MILQGAVSVLIRNEEKTDVVNNFLGQNERVQEKLLQASVEKDLLEKSVE